MTARAPLVQKSDLQGRTISSIMDQYAFVTRTISADLTVTPEYILSAQGRGGGYVVQKHFINVLGNEDMLYFRGDYPATGTPRTLFEADPSAFAFADFWEVF